MCWQAYEKAKSINPFIRHESFMRPFKFHPLPNVPFGIADPFPDPPREALEVFYWNPRHYELSFTGLHWL